MRGVLALVGVLLVASACAGGGSSAGLGDQTGAGGAALELVRADLPAATPEPAAAAPVVAGIDALTGRLAGQLAADGENLVVSPLGVATAFAMARAGAAGETAVQLDATLGFPVAGLGEGMRALEAGIVTQQGPPPRPSPGATPRDAQAQAAPAGEPPIVALANGLFAAPDLPLEQDFLATLATSHDTGVEQVDFTTPGAIEAIDAWADEQTAGLVPHLFDELPASTRMALATALYLKADWQVPFAEEPTTDEAFRRADASTVDVPTMQSLGARAYAEGDGWQAVDLPYVGDELVMRVLVPSAGTAPVELLAPEALAAVDAAMHEGVVDLALPRFHVTSKHDLVDALGALGLAAPFGPGADFSGISSEELWIADALQRATITVDEWGTEAAAVTGLGFDSSGPPPPDAVIAADRPFAFAIRHVPTGAPLFVGVVADPSVG